MDSAVVKIIPIFLFIVLGKIFEHKKLVSDITIHQMKLGIIKIALPMILFITFKNMELKSDYFLLSGITFLMMGLFFLFGKIVNRVTLKSIVLPFFVTGYAFGLLGIPLFEGVYGIEQLGELSILGIGNEFFIWFVYITLIKQELNNQPFDFGTLVSFIKSPMIIAIILGLVFNVLQVDGLIGGSVLYSGILATIDSVSAMTTPIILIVIGAGIKLDVNHVRKAVYFVVLRILVTLGLGLSIKFLIIDSIYETSHIFNLAYFTYLILPPPFTLAIFVSEYSSEENAIVVNNGIVISTVLSIVAFVAMVLITG